MLFEPVDDCSDAVIPSLLIKLTMKIEKEKILVRFRVFEVSTSAMV